MKSERRTPRSVNMNEAELQMAENVMEYYHLHTVSEVIRFLIIRENARIEAGVAADDE